MSNKKDSLDLSNINAPRSFILNKQRSYETNPISDIDAELSLDDDYPYKRKKPRSFNSFFSINGGGSRHNSLTERISKLFKGKEDTSHLGPMTVDEIIDEGDNQNSYGIPASHIAISPNGQYICTFDCSKYY